MKEMAPQKIRVCWWHNKNTFYVCTFNRRICNIHIYIYIVLQLSFSIFQRFREPTRATRCALCIQHDSCPMCACALVREAVTWRAYPTSTSRS